MLQVGHLLPGHSVVLRELSVWSGRSRSQLAFPALGRAQLVSLLALLLSLEDMFS